MTGDLAARLMQHFGFDEFRPGQREAIEHVLAGRSALVVMPTGAGKSLCYQLAALLLPGTTLVISPLIALMKDQVDRLEARGVAATFINSAIPPAEQRARLAGLSAGAYKLVYVAPERLRSRAFLDVLGASDIRLLAVDEAHCISHWGHDFRPDYLHIGPSRERLTRDGHTPPVLALTATATPQVQQDILLRLNARQAATIVTGFNRPNLRFEVRHTPDDKAKLRALQEVVGQTEGAGIIYTGTRRDAEEAAEFVSQVVGVETPFYHAGLETAERTRRQEAFMAGRVQVVAATNAFGMGIDRPDIRFVLHFSLPGTLEAYYQEAGRAGRDGLPARCVLLYAPEDRALQEWFINADATTNDDLRRLHTLLSTANEQPAWFDLEEVARETGMRDTKIRLALSQLETAGAVVRHRDAGSRVLLETRPLSDGGLEGVAMALLARRQHRLEQLGRMVHYAEASSCRRRIILEHFGDTGAAQAEACCDVCLMDAATAGETGMEHRAATDAEWVALIILGSVKLQKWNVGRSTLNKILRASKAETMSRYGYAQQKHFGRLAAFKRDEVNELIDQLIATGYLKLIGGRLPVLRLSPAGEAAVARRSAIPLRLPRETSQAERDRVRAEREAGGTVEYTRRLAQTGLTPAQIASERGLTESTILGHLATLIAAGQIPVESVVPPDVCAQVETVLDRAQPGSSLSTIKAQLPEAISFGTIRCVMAGREHGASRPPPRPSPEAGVPPGPGPATERQRWQARGPVEDGVEAFLAAPRPKSLPGTWQVGLALDFNSRFRGDRWARTEVGELAYHFKYGEQERLARTLARRLAQAVRANPAFGRLDGLIAVPPSIGDRPFDPVTSLARALAAELGVPALTGSLVKTRPTQPQKDMTNLPQKQANVRGAFAVSGRLNGKRVLVVDDLFDSGATLTEITRVLRAAGAEVCVAVLTKTIHADA